MNLNFENPNFKIDLRGLAEVVDAPKAEASVKETLQSTWQSFLQKTRADDIGFFDWPETHSRSEVLAIQDRAKYLRANYEGAICIGIGGSYLGPYAVEQALRKFEDEDKFPIVWVSNADTRTVERARHLALRKKVAMTVISKSGNTVETLAAFFSLFRLVNPDGLTIITDPNSGELRRLADENAWTSFAVPPNVGGRFSVLTPVGLFPLALAGIDIDALMGGATQTRSWLLGNTKEPNAAATLAYWLWRWDSEKRCSVQYLMPYHSALHRIGDWYVQLFAESLGKKQIGTKISVGPNPAPALGTSDQHSLLQLFKEGPKARVIGFIDCLEWEKLKIETPSFKSPKFAYLSGRTLTELNHYSLVATRESLALSDVPTYTLELKGVDALRLGSLLFFLEATCGVAGEFYRVNAYDQPGVEEAKILLAKALTKAT